jgi:hypothetical protein
MSFDPKQRSTLASTCVTAPRSFGTTPTTRLAETHARDHQQSADMDRLRQDGHLAPFAINALRLRNSRRARSQVSATGTSAALRQRRT